MSQLGPEAQELLREGRGSHQPSAADRERIARALRERLGPGFDGSNGAAPTTTNTWSALVWKGLAFMGTVVAVGAFVVTFSHGGQSGSVAAAAPPAAPTVADVAPTEPAKTALAPASDNSSTAPSIEPSSVEPPSAAAPRKSNRLAEEVSILTRAETELKAGRAAVALQLLEEHRRKFPSGALAQERIAARIHALCALGRTSEAESELARLKRVSPGSPQEDRAREACASGTKG